MTSVASFRALAVLVLALASAAHASGTRTSPRPADQAPAPAQPAPAVAIDLVVLDREARFIEDLRPGDLTVTVDGLPRRVLWLRRVSRGPGAMAEAAARQAQAPNAAIAAEPSRTVLIAVDQASIARGDERRATEAAASFLDRLGLDDRLAVLRLPAGPDSRLVFSTERPDARAALARVVGQLEVAAQVAAGEEPPTMRSVEPDRMTGLNRDRRTLTDPSVAAPQPTAAVSSLQALRAVFDGLASIPGRKVAVFLSAGLREADGRAVDDAAFAAAAAHVVVYALVVPSAGAEGGAAPSTAALGRLAAATGGASLVLGRNAEAVVARAAREVSACYVAGIEAVEQGAPGVRHPLRVESTRKGTTLRSAGWLVPVPDPGDRLPSVARAEAPGPAPAAEPVRRAKARGASGARSAELDSALARLFDYADGYERQYSMLVAEEDYRQSAPGGRVRLRSDVLLVRSGGDQWASFRDVFEVDGRPVRDRQERLRKLFLDPGPEAVATLDAIDRESARYNVGDVERTVNVPLLPISFLRAANRGRFEYTLGGRETAAGVEAWRVRYSERQRPTMIADAAHQDVPVSGWFLVDTISGAVVETRMEAKRGDSRALVTVRYRRDAALGLWVPGEMTEMYTEGGRTGRFGAGGRDVVEGRATYSNFRRYQVTITIEGQVKPVK